MRILVLGNIPLKSICENLMWPVSVTGGWIEGFIGEIIKQKDVTVEYVFPQNHVHTPVKGVTNKYAYYGFYYSLNQYDKDTVSRSFHSLIVEDCPDIIHIFGTEFPFALDLVEVCEENRLSDRIIVNIQGLIHVYADHYYAGLPSSVVYRFTLRDLLRRDNIYFQRKKYVKRGETEIQILQRISSVVGRTEWDCACVKQLNPSVTYYHCGEILRTAFYTGKWKYNNCEKHTIFISQGYYPIKGLHMMLHALCVLKKIYPDVKVSIAGMNDPREKRMGIISRKGSYDVYLCHLIKKYGLDHNVFFVGRLNDKEMKKMFLKTHVFVSASAIENSSNSVCEALMLGVPTVSSDVGGIKDFIIHGENGYIYPFDEPYMLAYYIHQLFFSEAIASDFSERAVMRAKAIHDKTAIGENMLNIYKKICTAQSVGKENKR